MKYLLFLCLSFSSFAYRLNTSNGAHFSNSTVKFYVTSNSTCTNAGVTADELLDIAEEAADKFWNKVSTSSLKLKSGGTYETSNSLFLTGILCPEQEGSSCDSATDVPYISKLLIACNNDTSENFPSDANIAIAGPTQVSGTHIKSSVILINDTASSTFASLSRSERVSVLAHELGHAVGLGHTDKSEALMYFKNPETISKLSQDDIDGISYLYPNEGDDCAGISLGMKRDDLPPPPGFIVNLLLGCLLYFSLKKAKSLVDFI